MASTPVEAGRIVAWGDDGSFQVTNVPSGSHCVAVAGFSKGGFGLRSNGSIAGWGGDFVGELTGIPTGTDCTAIAAGSAAG